ncbi:hypothetical protein JOF56_003318 [Kibdelosporangium banguiense]|uniref:Uncharacterized protein n=1 Tax=Kibdelosporangium banguiense TaxID=1365924 RepID=A0ABS4TEV3_9PSEU|nr:hypothetical protein [Kibdelosporangium banguiense]
MVWAWVGAGRGPVGAPERHVGPVAEAGGAGGRGQRPRDQRGRVGDHPSVFAPFGALAQQRAASWVPSLQYDLGEACSRMSRAPQHSGEQPKLGASQRTTTRNGAPASARLRCPGHACSPLGRPCWNEGTRRNPPVPRRRSPTPPPGGLPAGEANNHQQKLKVKHPGTQRWVDSHEKKGQVGKVYRAGEGAGWGFRWGLEMSIG